MAQAAWPFGARAQQPGMPMVMSLSLRWIAHPGTWVIFCAAVLVMVSGYAVAREFRAADNQPADYPSVRAL